jgi:hypothetical protein
MGFAALCSAAIETILSVYLLPFGELLDPDSYMRLVRIRHGSTAGLFTHIVPADNGGNGTIVYWSHLLDFCITALWVPLHALIPSELSLLVAGAITGPLFAAAFAAALVWAPYPLTKPHWRWLWIAPVTAVFFSPALMVYGLLGYVHYHLPLVLMSVVAAGWAGRALGGRCDAAFWCGISAAIGIWFSPEALPYVAMSMGAIGLGWCIWPTVMARPLKVVAASFASGVALALLVDPPNGGYLSAEPDCLSIVYLVLSVLICGATWLLVYAGRRIGEIWGRISLCLVTGAALVTVWLLSFPPIIHGLSGLVPAANVTAYFDAISEMQPLRLSLRSVGLLLPGILAVVAVFCLAWRTRSLLWAYLGLCGCAIIVLAQCYFRFLGYAEAAAALMLPVILEFVTSSQMSEQWKRSIRVSVLAAFLAAPTMLMLFSGESPDNLMAKCHVRDIRSALLEVNDAPILTEISDTPEILWRTGARTIGSFYHRSIEAFMLARSAWRSGPSQTVPDAVLATQARYILACDMNGRPSIVGDLPETTLQDRLDRHDVPSWLHEVAQAGGYRLYLIEKDFAGYSYGR